MASLPPGLPKTPVSLLQELCVRRHMTPVYDLIQVEGSVHEPNFQYRVTVGELQGESKEDETRTCQGVETEPRELLVQARRRGGREGT